MPKRILELNPKHAMVKNLETMVENDAKDPFVEQVCEQLFEGAMLVDGFLTDPHRLVGRMNEIIAEAAQLRTQK